MKLIFSQRILADDFWNNASELNQIGNEVQGRNNFFSYKTLGSNFWKVAREAEGKRIWDQIEGTLVPLDPGASLFVPGAKEHYMKNSYELNQNLSQKKKQRRGNHAGAAIKENSSTGGSYIEWMRLESDKESLDNEIASLFSDDASIIWMGDSPTELKSPPMPTLQALPRPPVELNVLENLDLNASIVPLDCLIMM
ncbi:hypothetical protein H4Q26_010382 [Puccinia striiformis f. sp. tritici PST-130]|nr:hypothetical protein H4Q26_010382 [Puccinia striiformis f. sp. tritici PST-130]